MNALSVQMPTKTIEWFDGKVRLIDQTKLPTEIVFLEISDYRLLIEAIQSLRIRGAPAIGIAAAYGIVLGAKELARSGSERFTERVRGISHEIIASRPTAINMAWAAKRLDRLLVANMDPDKVVAALLNEAHQILDEDLKASRSLAAHGARLIPDRTTVLTHCNAGSLATSGYGTALGVIRSAREVGKSIRVITTETRPLLQGARLTSWELLQDGFDTTLITDSMAGHFLSAGAIGCVVVGADRIAMNGDVANKIGTYSLAVLAKENRVPFYVAAPISTIDCSAIDGSLIPVEERPPDEITNWGGIQVAPKGIKVANPAFDVTPHRYVTSIVTERGVAQAPYTDSLSELVE